MITNTKIKVFLINTIFSIISLINKCVKHDKKIVLFYNNLEFRDNNKALYDYLIKYGYNNRFTIYCASLDYKKFKHKAPINVFFISKYASIIKFFRAGTVIYCVGHLPIEIGNDQNAIQLWHGGPMKKPTDGTLATHSYNKTYYSFVLSTSALFIPFWESHFKVPKRKFVICGYPRNDVLFEDSPNYDYGTYKKLIIWAPTFRASSLIGHFDSANKEIIPILRKEDFVMFDDFLKSIGVKVVVKLHPVQDLKQYNLFSMDNFILLSHQDFVRKGMDLYRLMVQSDALITDFSSIYYDYLLLNRPIGFTTDDISAYHRGFWTDNIDEYKPGPKINDVEDLKLFCLSVVNENDHFTDMRNKVNELVNNDREGGYCKKILGFLGIE